MLLARSHHGARESIEAAREAQKAIALEPDLLEAYALPRLHANEPDLLALITC